ncbi:cupin domain-containing protein [Roseibium salinum]|nr:cupin domain-containing protein [Roseibium salinum]
MQCLPSRIWNTIWCFLSGTLRVALGSDFHDLSPGDALRFRLNTPNSYRATGDEAARYILTVITP